MRVSTLARGVSLLLLCACGGGDERPLPADARVASIDAAAGPAAIDLSVVSARRYQRVASAPNVSPKPESGYRLIGVQLSLSNTGEPRPLPINESTFSLLTATGVSYQQSAQTALASDPCPMGAAVVKGGKLTCQVVFEIPWAAAVRGLSYADETGRMATAVFSSVEPAQVLCENWPTPASNCVPCLNLISSSVQFCGLQRAAMTAACTTTQFPPSSCVATTSCPSYLADCAVSDACAAAVDVYQGCLYDSCQLSCLQATP